MYWSLKNLVHRFYTSRFNREPDCDLAEGEDIDNSRKFRMYNKGEVLELLELFCDFFQWVIVEENISKVYLSKDIYLIRESILPRVKRATQVDCICVGGDLNIGDYYVTHGKYTWKMWIGGDVYKRLKELASKDPQMIELRKEFDVIAEEKNSAKQDIKNEPSE